MGYKMRSEKEIKDALDLILSVLGNETNLRIPEKSDREALGSFAAALSWTTGKSETNEFHNSLCSLRELYFKSERTFVE